MQCPDENATNPIWRVLASSDEISSWTPLKPQHSNPNPNPKPLANQLWCIDFLTLPTPLITPHRLPAVLDSKTDARFIKMWHYFQVLYWILLHIVLLKCRHVQIGFLKFTRCDNQALVGCIPITVAAAHLNLKS